MNLEGIGSIVSAVGLVGTIWKVSTAYSEMRHKLEIKDQQMQAFLEKQELILNGVRENFSHFSNRFRGEVERAEDRIGQLEEFLAKTTDFHRRK